MKNIKVEQMVISKESENGSWALCVGEGLKLTIPPGSKAILFSIVDLRDLLDVIKELEK